MNSFQKHITPAFILKFTIPTMFMMLFNSFYTMVDGAFVSNFVSTEALSAINIVFPILSLVLSIGIMLACGGSAIVAKQLGENKVKQAKENFSLILLFGSIIGIILMTIGIFFTKQIVIFLGANDVIYAFCYDYAFCLSLFIPFYILQLLFQFFFTTAGRPQLGLLSTLLGGLSNIILDYLLIVVLNIGIKGAAIATGIGFIIPATIGILYFSGKRDRIIHFVKPVFNRRVILKACSNGSSEMVSNLSVAITTILFNIKMMNYLGEDGVAAMTIVFYAQFLFTSIFMGYTSGVAPLISFNYGAKNKENLTKLFKISLKYIIICSAVSFVFSNLFSNAVVGIFSSHNNNVFNIATEGMKLFSISFLFMGFNIFISGMFTALSNGKISAILSFLRTFVFIVISISTLPLIFQLNGIWLSIPVAEILSILVSIIYTMKFKKVYGY